MSIVVKLVLKLKKWFSLEVEFSRNLKKEGNNNELHKSNH